MSSAAETLGRAASAISRSIQELEAALEAKLFERTNRRWLLTEAGQILKWRAELAFAELDKARDVLCDQYPLAAVRLRKSHVFALAVHNRHIQLLFAFNMRCHISTAAAVVGISQPAASMALHDLEANVGVPLFERTHSGVTLTDAGELLVAHLKRALTHLRLASDEIPALGGLMAGKIVVGALPFSRPYVLPVAIGRLLAKYPRLRVRTMEAPFEMLRRSLDVGDIDFLIGALPSGALEGEPAAQELVRQRMVVIAAKGHPLARKTKVTLADVGAAAWVLPPDNTPTRTALNQCLEKQRMPLTHVAVESSDISIIRGLLLEAGMLTAASPQLFQRELASGILVALPLALPGTERVIGLLRRSRENSSPGAKLLIAEIESVAAGSHLTSQRRSAFDAVDG